MIPTCWDLFRSQEIELGMVMPRTPAAPWSGPEFWASIRADVWSALGLPPTAYADEAFFVDEQSRLFGRAWTGVALAAELSRPGRLLVRSVGGKSVLLTRSGERLRGFLNSCRHRGTELAEADCDIRGIIRCPYHRWSYSTDGWLVAAPLFAASPPSDFDPADWRLVPVRVDTWGPIVFVCFDEQAPPLDVWLGDLPERLAGYRLDKWQPAHLDGATATFDVAANWKLIIENFAEYYHLPWVHPKLAKVSRVKDHYRYQGPEMDHTPLRRSFPEADTNHLPRVGPERQQRVITQVAGVAVGGALLRLARHRTDRGVQINGHRPLTGTGA